MKEELLKLALIVLTLSGCAQADKTQYTCRNKITYFEARATRWVQPGTDETRFFEYNDANGIPMRIGANNSYEWLCTRALAKEK